MNQPVSDAFHCARDFLSKVIANPRAAAWLAFGTALTLLAGCSHTVRFADLTPIAKVDDVAELRRADLHGLKNGLPGSDDYLVGESDLIELTAADGLVQPISASCTSDCTKCVSGDRMDAEVHLAEIGSKVRVTAFVLESVSALRIGLKAVCLGPVIGQPWLQLKKALDAFDSPRVTSSIIPQAKRWAMPGDTVRVAVEYRFGLRQGAAVEPFTFAEMGTRVDSGGRAYIPALSAVRPETTGTKTSVASTSEADAPAKALVDAAQSPYSALQVVAEQQAQSAARYVVFWTPSLSLAKQPTLDELEHCLKAVSSTQPLNAAFTKCPELGIDQYRYQPNPTHNRQVSYRLLTEHKVTFVFWDGRRHAVPYLLGQSVADGVRAIYRDVVARDIGSDDQLFATVDPHVAIRAGGERPFYARLAASPGAILDQVLLLPGDVVYLSRWEPQRPL